MNYNATANPSFHPKCYSGLRPLAHSGELKRYASNLRPVDAEPAGICAKFN